MRVIRQFFVVLVGAISLLKTQTDAYPAETATSFGFTPRSPENSGEYPHPNESPALEDRSLFSCFSSLCCFRQRPGGTQMAWVCTNDWPSLDSLKAKVNDHGNVGNKISFFYTVCHQQLVVVSPSRSLSPGYCLWLGYLASRIMGKLSCKLDSRSTRVRNMGYTGGRCLACSASSGHHQDLPRCSRSYHRSVPEISEVARFGGYESAVCHSCVVVRDVEHLRSRRKQASKVKR